MKDKIKERLLNFCDVFDTQNGAYLREGDVINFILNEQRLVRQDTLKEVRMWLVNKHEDGEWTDFNLLFIEEFNDRFGGSSESR